MEKRTVVYYFGLFPKIISNKINLTNITFIGNFLHIRDSKNLKDISLYLPRMHQDLNIMGFYRCDKVTHCEVGLYRISAIISVFFRMKKLKQKYSSFIKFKEWDKSTEKRTRESIREILS